MAAVSSRSPCTAVAPASTTVFADLSERASARTVQPSRTRRRMRAPPTKPEPPVTKAVGTAAKLPLLGGVRARMREVRRALFDDDRLLQDEVAHADLARSDLRVGAIAAIVGEPGRASDRGGREAAYGPERAVPAAPEVAPLALWIRLLLA